MEGRDQRAAREPPAWDLHFWASWEDVGLGKRLLRCLLSSPLPPCPQPPSWSSPGVPAWLTTQRASGVRVWGSGAGGRAGLGLSLTPCPALPQLQLMLEGQAGQVIVAKGRQSQDRQITNVDHVTCRGSSDAGSVLVWCTGVPGGVWEGGSGKPRPVYVQVPGGCRGLSQGHTVPGVWVLAFEPRERNRFGPTCPSGVDRSMGPLLSAAGALAVGGLVCLLWASVSPGAEGNALRPLAAPPSAPTPSARRLGGTRPFPGDRPCSFPPLPIYSLH